MEFPYCQERRDIRKCEQIGISCVGFLVRHSNWRVRADLRASVTKKKEIAQRVIILGGVLELHHQRPAPHTGDSVKPATLGEKRGLFGLASSLVLSPPGVYYSACRHSTPCASEPEHAMQTRSHCVLGFRHLVGSRALGSPSSNCSFPTASQRPRFSMWNASGVDAQFAAREGGTDNRRPECRHDARPPDIRARSIQTWGFARSRGPYTERPSLPRVG